MCMVPDLVQQPLLQTGQHRQQPRGHQRAEEEVIVALQEAPLPNVILVSGVSTAVDGRKDGVDEVLQHTLYKPATLFL